jgi:hypothetical protein
VRCAIAAEYFKGHLMRKLTGYDELTLQSALSDPLIRTVMAADKVDPVQLELMLRKIAKKVAAPRQPSQREAACELCD